MKGVAYLLIGLSLMLLVSTAYDEYRGVASVTTRNMARITVAKADDPGQFHDLITYEWIRAFVVMGGGAILLSICRSADRLDPFSPTFNGNDELDELGEELDREREKRQRPPR
ncbi:MAG: hypothetical protein ABSF34_09450 [Verrucomicrobiota bacterium]|jgi:hypothetical protein